MTRSSSSTTLRSRLALTAGGLAVVAASVLAGGVAPASASQTLFCPADQYCAWEDDLQQGLIFNHNATLSFVGAGWNDKFSSLQNNRSRSVIFYQHDQGQGYSRLLTAGAVAKQLQYEWRDNATTWNDDISSVTAY